MTPTNLDRSDLDDARLAFRDGLVDAGLLIPTGPDGLYGRAGVFDDIVDGLVGVVQAAATTYHGGPVDRYRFPPVYPRESFEKTDYIASFPNLTGSVNTFLGDNKRHRGLLSDREAGRSWDHHLEPAGTMLVSAACHPSYSMLPSQLPDKATIYEVLGYCFRHEPAVDPARMQAFRMIEVVCVGSAADAAKHREDWVLTAGSVLRGLGIEVDAVIANDPFFGRAGQMLAANQRDENLKTELVTRLYGDLDGGTAIASANCHRDHFGEAFGLQTGTGEVAHSACVGFGLERVVLALLRTHGFSVADWPSDVRRSLALTPSRGI